MSPRTLDYYAVLQVAPDAEQEVIEAAYRQLMRKYHPDKAGTDEDLARDLNERAKMINQAYAVLRDPQQRFTYDGMRSRTSTRSPAAEPRARPHRPAPEPPNSAWSEAAASTSATPVDWQTGLEHTVDPEASSTSWFMAPWRALTAAFFMLPGRYEWEGGGQREFAATLLLVPIGMVVWLATTGRLSGVLGQSPYAVLAVWIAAAALVVITHWSGVLRVAVASGATVVLLGGWLNPVLGGVGVPVWVGWSALVTICLLVAARPFVFGVLPTLAVCWLLGRVV